MPDVATLPAGRELDACVCRALGIHGRIEYYAKTPSSENAGWFFSEYRSEVERLIDERRRSAPDSEYARSTIETVTHYPRVSEDMGAAWLAVERLNAIGWLVAVRQMPEGVPYSVDPENTKIHARAVVSLQWVQWMKDSTADPFKLGPTTVTDSTPLAICRAALTALGAA